MAASGKVKLHFTSSSTVFALQNRRGLDWQSVRAFSLAAFDGLERLRPTLIYRVRLSSNPSFFLEARWKLRATGIDPHPRASRSEVEVSPERWRKIGELFDTAVSVSPVRTRGLASARLRRRR